MFGYGDMARIDLSSGTIEREPVDPALAKKFIGGMGINDWLLWEHFLKVDPRVDPLDEDNVLIVGVGPLGGTATCFGTKTKFTFKSPLTGFFGDTTSGGTFGAQLRWAGIDYLVITGRAPWPVYIYIENAKIEIRDARCLWGLTTDETIEALYAGGVPDEAGIVCIGPAGENGVRYASLIVTHHRAAARAGGGCVAGSKNLKAIVALGSRGIDVYDKKAALNAAEKIYQVINNSAGIDRWKKIGSTMGVAYYNTINGNAFRNNQFTKTADENIAKISADWYIENLKLRDISCSPGCTFGCGSTCEVRGNETPFARKIPGFKGYSPEYITVGSFGMACDIHDYPAILFLGDLCNKYGLDYEEIGGIIPFLMELRQRGIINEQQVKEWFGEELALEWGSAEAVVKIIESIALQENTLGRMCSYSTGKLCEFIEAQTGACARRYSMAGKGGMVVPEEVRPFPIWCVMAATNTRGCDVMKGFNFIDKTGREDVSLRWFGKKDAGIKHVPDLKGKAAAAAENYISVFNCLGICMFRASSAIYPLDMLAEAYAAITGMDMTENGLLLAAERAYNVEKAFNVRVGLRRSDDTLCPRWMDEPIRSGPGEGMKARDFFDRLLDEYYEYRGWDPVTSIPTRKKLEELDLAGIAEAMEK
ncbi:MAG: aldehyde ferredoxin oxidoreductase C-terminal domain-containing protein [Peptococcaceae bacterium]|jgi:aldehyde:ferredoxin oxidoreductase|nr:hypothetical protein [Peptococcaceae bacterium]MDH7525036.1 aldehyde ferredoxin oxidoreductase C-terminal domain-containing protein [Peptococcaceae bacterium]